MFHPEKKSFAHTRAICDMLVLNVLICFDIVQQTHLPSVFAAGSRATEWHLAGQSSQVAQEAGPLFCPGKTTTFSLQMAPTFASSSTSGTLALQPLIDMACTPVPCVVTHTMVPVGAPEARLSDILYIHTMCMV